MSNAAATDELVIETDGLTKRYGEVVAVDQLSLRVPRGGVFGFLGPNGSGKTTTMGMLLGLVQRTSGEAHIFGDQVGRSDTLRRIGAMVESPTFYPYLSGRANLRYFQGIGRRGTPADIDRLLDLVDLGKRADSKFSTYSLGMKQRLGIAAALLKEPDLLILDEPTNGLDPAGIVEIRELLRDLGRNGRTIIVSSHQLAEIEAVCDHLVVIRFGKLVFSGPMAEMMKRTREHIDIAAEHAADMGRLEAELARAGWSVSVKDHVLRVAAGAPEAADLNRAATAAGVTLSRLVVAQDSLEEIFLEMTGRVDGELANGRAAINGREA